MNAEYHHNGALAGVPGLKSDEVAAILQKNEEVLPTSDPRHQFNLNKGRPSTASQQPRFTINNILDAPSLASAMEGAEGERMVMNHIRANRSEIKTCKSYVLR